MGWANLDLDDHGLVVQRGRVADFQHVDGVADRRQLLLCDGLSLLVGVLDVQIGPHFSVLEFTIQDLKSQAQGRAVAGFEGLDSALGDQGRVVTCWNGIAGCGWVYFGCVKIKGHDDGLSGWGKWLVFGYLMLANAD